MLVHQRVNKKYILKKEVSIINHRVLNKQTLAGKSHGRSTHSFDYPSLANHFFFENYSLPLSAGIYISILLAVAVKKRKVL